MHDHPPPASATGGCTRACRVQGRWGAGASSGPRPEQPGTRGPQHLQGSGLRGLMQAGRLSGGHGREPSGTGQVVKARSYLFKAWDRAKERSVVFPESGEWAPLASGASTRTSSLLLLRPPLAGAAEPPALGPSRRTRPPSSTSLGSRSTAPRPAHADPPKTPLPRARTTPTGSCPARTLRSGNATPHSSGLPRHGRRRTGSGAPTPRRAQQERVWGGRAPSGRSQSRPRVPAGAERAPVGARRALRLRPRDTGLEFSGRRTPRARGVDARPGPSPRHGPRACRVRQRRGHA